MLASTMFPGCYPAARRTIVQAWFENGNAHGYHRWMVLAGSTPGQRGQLVPFEGEPGDTISDSPFDGERVIGAVRFLRARLDDRPSTLVATARLDESNDRPLADHALATIRLYRLATNDDGLGPPLRFVHVTEIQSGKRYCNAHLALRDVLRIPLPADYAGLNKTDGCLPD